MKTIKFRPELIQEILEGKKRATFRLFDDKDFQEEETVTFINWETGEQFATAEITNIKEKPLGKLDKEDFEGHSTYESTEAMIEGFKKYYGDNVTEETIVKVIQFNLR